MKTTFSHFAVYLAFLFVAASPNLCYSDTNSPARMSFAKASPEYQDAALGAMLAEANVYAQQMNLPEQLPLTAKSLTERYITSPRVADNFGALGSFRTTNFSYGFSKARHLTSITRLPKDKSNKSLYERFKPWSINPASVDTNAAYRTAVRLLTNAFVNVPLLSQSLKVSISPMVVQDMTTSIYTVEWLRNDSPVVEITFADPKSELWTLRVEDAIYILRKPLDIPNLAELLNQTNAPPKTNSLPKQ